MFTWNSFALLFSILVLHQPMPEKPNPVRDVVYSKDGKVVFTARENTVFGIRVIDSSVVSKFNTDSRVVSGIALSSDGKTIAIGHGKAGLSGEITVLNLGDDLSFSKPIFKVNGHADLIHSIRFSPDGRLIASCGYDRLVKIWSVQQGGALVQELKDHSDAVYAVAFNKDGTMLASAGADRAIKVWDTRTWKKLHTLNDSTDWVYTLSWSPVKNQLLGAGVDQALRVWTVERENAKLFASAFAHTSGVNEVVWTSDGSRIISIGEDKVWKTWNAEKLSEIKSFKSLSDTPLHISISPDGLNAAIARVDNKLELFDLKSGDVVKTLMPFVEPKAAFKSVEPSFLTLGAKTSITFRVDNFDPPFVAFSSTSGVKLSQPGSSGDGALKLDVQVEPTAAPGFSKITCKNMQGREIEFNLEVDRYSRKFEIEPNDSRLTGQSLELPVSIKSSLQRPGDCDWFYIDARSGQEIVIQLQAEKDEKNFSPMMQLVAPDGTVVGESSKGWLGHVCRQKGRYAIEVRDRDYRGGEIVGSYRLHVGTFPIVTSIFPLGAQIGKESTWTIQGVGLGGKNVLKASLPNSRKAGDKVTFEEIFPSFNVVPGKAIVVSDVPEKNYQPNEMLEVPGVGNGWFENQKDVHSWKFSAKKNQKLIIETMGSRLGSNVDTFLEILDSQGNPIPRAVLRGLSKTYTIFRDHDSATPGIRLETWNELAVNDFVLIGTELMKIRALPRNPDDDCRFFQIDNKRIAYEGTTPVFHYLGQPIYKVSLNPPGANFPPNGLPIVTLFHQNDDGGPRYGKDSLVEFDPPTDGVYIARVREMQGKFGPESSYRLLVRHPKPDYNLKLTPSTFSPVPGSGIPVNVEIDRLDGFDAAVDVKISGLPPGFLAPSLVVPKGENSASFSMFAQKDAKNPPSTQGKWTVKSSAIIGGVKSEKELQFDPPKLGAKGDLITTTASEALEVKAGSEVKILVKIERGNGFTGRVPLDVRGLPHGSRVLDIGLNGILVTPKETERLVTIQVDSWIEPGSYPFVVLSKQEGKNVEFAAKTVIMNVVK